MARYIDADKFREKAFYADTEADIVHYTRLYGYADVVPKSEVDKWIRECEELQGRLIELEKEVAREIFEEIDELLVQNATMQIATSTLHCKLAELKKKYIGE